jgi:hypothetical protein
MADEFPTQIKYELIPVEGHEEDMLRELAKLSDICELHVSKGIVFRNDLSKTEIEMLLKRAPLTTINDAA